MAPSMSSALTPNSERRHNYQEVVQIASASTPRRRKTYRGGFHTSICDIFRDPHSRTDCCAVACCGVLASDRNRYLLSGERPPLWRRVLLYFVIPFLFIGAIGYFTVDVPVVEDGEDGGDGGDGELTMKVPPLGILWSFYAYIGIISIWAWWVSATKVQLYHDFMLLEIMTYIQCLLFTEQTATADANHDEVV